MGSKFNYYMPITKSAKKALRQNIKHKYHNTEYKKKLRGFIKQARILVSQEKHGEAAELIPLIYKTADKAAKENVIKKKAADRTKSRLAHLIAKKTAVK